MKISGQDQHPHGSDSMNSEPGSDANADRCASNERADLLAELKGEITARDIASISELQAVADEVFRRRNLRSRDNFCGLSSEQMHHILHLPFDSAGIVSFSEDTVIPSDVSAHALVSLLVDACGDQGLKATAKGYLPAKFCRDTALAVLGEEGCRYMMFGSEVRKELDYRELHVVRLATQMGGLIRKYRGRFLRTKKGEKALSSPNNGKLYFELLKAYTGKFNWGYSDRYPDLMMIQEAFLFSLFLLHRYGDESRCESFYADKFLQAFPSVVDEIREPLYGSKADEIMRCYAVRTMKRFAHLFGLIELDSDSSVHILRDSQIKKSPLLDQLVSFHV